MAYNPDDSDRSRENSPFSQTYSDELSDLLDNPELLELLDNPHKQKSHQLHTNSTDQINDNCAQSPLLTSSETPLRDSSIGLSDSGSPVKQLSFSITSVDTTTAEETSFERKRKNSPKTIENYFMPSSQDEEQLGNS